MATVTCKLAVPTPATGIALVLGSGVRADRRPWQVPTHLSFVFASHGRRQAYQTSEAGQEEPAMLLAINKQMRGFDANDASPLQAGRPAVWLGVARSRLATFPTNVCPAGGCMPAASA